MGRSMNNTIVVVEWIDASYEDGPLSLREIEPLIRLKSVGWLLREDKESISIAMEKADEDELFRSVTHIPKVGIIKIKRIKV
jgi:hypothetical protein